MDIIQKIKKLVEKNSIDEALYELEKFVVTNYFDLQKEIVLLKSRANEIKRRRILGVIDFNEELVEINKIKHSILLILDHLKEEQRQAIKPNIEIKVVERNRTPSILGNILREYLNLLRVDRIGTVLVVCGVIYSLIWLFNGPISQKSKRKALFEVLLDKNKFKEAESFIDSVYILDPDFDRELMQQQIFNKKIDLFWNDNKVDSMVNSFRNYNFRHIFPDNFKSPREVASYNQETAWFNSEIEKANSRLCKIDKSRAYLLINTYFRPKATKYDSNDDHTLKCYRDFSEKTILSELVNKCN